MRPAHVKAANLCRTSIVVRRRRNRARRLRSSQAITRIRMPKTAARASHLGTKSPTSARPGLRDLASPQCRANRRRTTIPIDRGLSCRGFIQSGFNEVRITAARTSRHGPHRTLQIPTMSPGDSWMKAPSIPT